MKVQCHEPSGSRPGFIVLQSDYIDNLRSTYTQLQRCFSTSYKDIMDINDNEHALMPKLKDIYRKVRIRKSKVRCVLPMTMCVRILHGLVSRGRQTGRRTPLYWIERYDLGSWTG